MESDSSLSAIALIVSLATFLFTSLANASIGSLRRDRIDFLKSHGRYGSGSLTQLSVTPAGPTSAAVLLSALSFAACLVSGVFLSLSLPSPPLLTVTFVSLGVLITLGITALLANRLALWKGEQIALALAPLFRGLTLLLTPIFAIQSFVTRGIIGRSSAGKNGSITNVANGDVALPLESQSAPLDEYEVRMIRAVVQLDQTTAREIMVPRVDIAAAEIHTSISSLAEQMLTNGYSRLPIYDGDLDHIEGVAHARDLLGKLGQDESLSENTLKATIRPAFFIPESKTLEELLNEFQQQRVQMAIVIDEYGGVSGLVTIEDLLEEIVGEIQDEFDTGEINIEKISDDEYVIDARVSINDLNQILGSSVESNGFDTIGGFVYDRLGKIPSVGDLVSYDGFTIEVLLTVGRRLKSLRVKKTVTAHKDVFEVA